MTDPWSEPQHVNLITRQMSVTNTNNYTMIIPTSCRKVLQKNRQKQAANLIPTFTIRSLRAFVDCNSSTRPRSASSLLLLALFPRESSRSVLHFASITDLELFTFLHRIFAMTLAMPLAGCVCSPSSCNELALSSLCSLSVSTHIKYYYYNRFMAICTLSGTTG